MKWGLRECVSCNGTWNEAPGTFTFHPDSAFSPLRCPRCHSNTLTTGTANTKRRFRCTECGGFYERLMHTSSDTSEVDGLFDVALLGVRLIARWTKKLLALVDDAD